MPDDFLHRVQLLAINFRAFAVDLLDAAAHVRDQAIRDAFKDHPRYADDGMARHLTNEWGQPVTLDQVKIARAQPDRFRMVYDRAQKAREELSTLLSKVYNASKRLSPDSPERSLFQVIEIVKPLIDEPFDEHSLKEQADAVKEPSARLSAEVEAVAKQRNEIPFDRSLPANSATDKAMPQRPTTCGPAASGPPVQTAPGMIAQFLKETGNYLTYWNLYRRAAENAKPTQQPWQGGTLITKPSEDQLAKMMELHEDHLDWGVKLEKTGRELAKSLTLGGYDDAAKDVLTIIHRARGGGGGAQKVFPIWERTKTELERISILLESTGTADTVTSTMSENLTDAVDSDSVGGEVVKAEPETGRTHDSDADRSKKSSDLSGNDIADPTAAMTCEQIARRLWGLKDANKTKLESAKKKALAWMQAGRLPANRTKRGLYVVSRLALEDLEKVERKER